MPVHTPRVPALCRLGIGRKDLTVAMGMGAVNEVVERVVRADVGRLLHNEYPGKAVCIDCLAATFPAGSPPFTRIEIRRALREMTESPGSLDFLRSFLCHLCREERPCLVSSTTT
jgi:hypothetical protein